MSATEVPPLAHSVDAAARRLGIGRSTVYELIQRRELQPVKIGARTLIPDSQLVALLDRLQAPQAQA